MFPPPMLPMHGNRFNTQERVLTLTQARQAFEAEKHTMARAFLAELDRVVTDGKLTAITRSSGGIEVAWRPTLKSVAGRAIWYRDTLRTFDTTTKPAKLIPVHMRKAAIELALRIIDNEDKLLNVMAHEFCHLANMLISNVYDKAHGKSFKEWEQGSLQCLRTRIFTSQHTITMRSIGSISGLAQRAIATIEGIQRESILLMNLAKNAEAN
ncbi:MAG: hypothetical protein GOMPHAMPRED_001228 [Gomphillus americanus]|uniref:SprT-like domain-containing protein n=1 Tax=Gomphillus americanus TaxID=1940652 RepID=A0A8H3F7C2_9LECA|nr:MAG: hypothetical protein GOMPHAMPRED_001228 [Gomphillus americanus]